MPRGYLVLSPCDVTVPTFQITFCLLHLTDGNLEAEIISELLHCRHFSTIPQSHLPEVVLSACFDVFCLHSGVPRPYPLSLLRVVPLLLPFAARPCPSSSNSCCVLSSASAKWFVHPMLPSHMRFCVQSPCRPLWADFCIFLLPRSGGPRASSCWSVPFGFPFGFSSSESTVQPSALSLVTQPCLTLCDPMDWSPPGSSCPRAFSSQEYQSGLP